MPLLVDIDEEFKIGEAWFGSVSPREDWSVVFEDDGTTGYFYATEWDTKGEGSVGKVLDALHIYDVAQVTDRHKPSRVQLGWNQDGTAAILLINKHPHAIFDMKGKRATCRTGFPPPAPDALFQRTQDWDPALVSLFK